MNIKSILITGTNRGIGKQLVQLLAQRNPQIKIYATVRNHPQKMQNQWNNQFPKNNIHCYQLDIMNNLSIEQFIHNFSQTEKYIDVIINNAAIGADLGQNFPSVQLATRTLRCNVTSTIIFTNYIMKFLADNGKIINISSRVSGIRYQPQEGQIKLLNCEINEKDIEQYIKDYIKGCEKGYLGIWWQSSYGTSKAFLNAWSRFILSKQLKENQRQMCFGFSACKTQMGPKTAKLQPIQGAQFVYKSIWIIPKQGVFYHNDKQYDFFAAGPDPKPSL